MGSWRRALIVVGLTVACTLAARQAEACSCVPDMTDSPCGGLVSSNTIFSGEVIDIRFEERRFGTDQVVRRQRVTLGVIERLIATPETATVVVITGVGGGDCGYPFVRGSRYLVYANANAQGVLGVGICGRTRRLENAEPDLSLLRSAAPDTARVVGTVHLHPDYYRPEDVRPSPSGVTIVLSSGATRVERVTNALGQAVFELPVGSWSISAAAPPGLYVSNWRQSIDIRDLRACPRVDFSLRPDGHVKGRILTSDGVPAVNLALELDAMTEYGRGAGGGRTNSRGEFDFGRLRSGIFTLVLPTTPRTVLPISPRAVDTFELKASAVLDVGDVRLPRGMRLATMSGRLLDEAGRPAANVQVFVRAEEAGGRSDLDPILTDANGEFSVAVIAGMGYSVSADRQGSNGIPYARAHAIIQAANDASPFTLHLRPY